MKFSLCQFKFSRLYITIAICLFALNGALAQTPASKGNPSPLKFPTPKGIANQVFYLQRDPNTNTLIYEINVKEDGKIDDKEPLLYYWLTYGEKKEKKDLSYIQRKFAYGVQTKALGKDQFELRFVSYKKLPLYLVKSSEANKYHVYVTINNKKLQLDRIFVRIEGGSFWVPNVKYVEFKGIDQETNTVVIERMLV